MNGHEQFKNKTPTTRPNRPSMTETQPSHLNKTLLKLMDRFQVQDSRKQGLLQDFSQTLLK
jgi:hypothetical protein